MLKRNDDNDVGTRVAHLARNAELGWVAEALVERREPILNRWREVCGGQSFHLGRHRVAVADHIPALFDAIVDLLQRTGPRASPGEAPLEDPAILAAARAHARVRFEQGLTAGDVVTEFRVLRQEIGGAIREAVDDDASADDVIGAELLVHDALDGAIALALNALSVHLEELREEFLATTLHDVQQPLTAMKGNVQLAIRRLGQTGDDPEMLALLRRVDAETKRMVLLLGILSDASRLTLGRLEPRFADADLGAISQALLARLESGEASRVQVETSEADLGGQWDPDMVERVVANLVSNALKYSPPDETVRVTIDADLESVKVSVTDNGIGLAQDDLPRLFTRYGRAGGAATAGVEGLGLGLFLSRGIVEAHGGRIWAESPGPGRGSTFVVILPRIPPVPEVQSPSE